MQYHFLGAVVLTVALSPLSTASAEELRVAAYDGYASQPIVDSFIAAEKAAGHSTTVVVQSIGNNQDCFDVIRANKADVVSLTNNGVKAEKFRFISGKQLEAINSAMVQAYADLLPTLQNADFLSEGGVNFGVPMNYGVLGIGYRTDKFQSPPDSWAILRGNTPYAVSTDWPECNVAIAALIAGVPAGDIFNVDKVSTPAVKNILHGLAKGAAKLWTGVDDAASLKDLTLASSWGFAFADLAKLGQSWAMAEPKEGYLGYVDSLVINAKATPAAKELAYRWISHVISPATQAILARTVGGFSVNRHTTEALTPAEASAAKLDQPDFLAKHTILLKALDVRSQNGLTRLWDDARK